MIVAVLIVVSYLFADFNVRDSKISMSHSSYEWYNEMLPKISLYVSDENSGVRDACVLEKAHSEKQTF